MPITSITRRASLVGLSAGLSACALKRVGGIRTPHSGRPNLIVILADDLGWSDTSPFGGETYTPHLARLAAGGVRATHFYNIGKCYPSRASLLTGLLNHRAGFAGGIARDEGRAGDGPYRGYLAEETPTLAEILQPLGYRSYLSGKWHVGEARKHWPDQRGFDRSFSLISGASSYYELRNERERIRRMSLDGEPWTPPAEGFYATNAYADKAVEFLADHERLYGEDPFFLYLAFTAPHFPLHAPIDARARYAGRYRNGWDVLRRERFMTLLTTGVIDQRFAETMRPDQVPAWENVADRALWEARMETYAAMITLMDEAIGRVLAQVEAMGELDNTLIIFASDNGASHEDVSGRNAHDHGTPIGDRGSYEAINAPWAWAANAPFRFHKETTFEGGITSSAIIHWPQQVKPGGMLCDRLHVSDIVPTMLDAFGQSPDGYYGRSMMPVLQGRAVPERALFTEHAGWGALISDGWKLVRTPKGAQWYLFNLEEDPVESRELAALHPVRLKAMQDEWTATAQREGVRL